VREAWCTKLLARSSGDADSEDADAVWCRDFVVDGGIGGRGSCCRCAPLNILRFLLSVV
jgi:hypothetical protein